MTDSCHCSVFPLGSYIPYEPGYSQTYSLPKFNTMGMAGPNMGIPVARPYPGPKLPVGSMTATYNRGGGRYKPFISLPTFNSYASTGNPCGFNPMSGYGGSGNPNLFNVFNAYPSPSNPTGAMNPVGEMMPANIGHPTRIGNGVGGMDTMGAPYRGKVFALGADGYGGYDSEDEEKPGKDLTIKRDGWYKDPTGNWSIKYTNSAGDNFRIADSWTQPKHTVMGPSGQKYENITQSGRSPFR